MPKDVSEPKSNKRGRRSGRSRAQLHPEPRVLDDLPEVIATTSEEINAIEIYLDEILDEVLGYNPEALAKAKE